MGEGTMGESGSVVTVIIPTFNDWNCCEEKLDQLAAQTWNRMQVIVVDDGSQDPPPETLFAAGRSTLNTLLIRLPVNQGTNAAVQAGLREVTGEFIFLTATNDPIAPNFLEKSVGALQKYPQAALCFSEPGVTVGWGSQKQKFSLGLAKTLTFFSPDAFAGAQCRAPFHIATNTTLYRAKNLLSVGGYRPELDLYADIFPSLLLSLTNGSVYIPEVLAYERLHESRVSSLPMTRRQKNSFASKILLEFRAAGPVVSRRFKSSCIVSLFGTSFVCLAVFDKQLRSFVTRRAVALVLLRDLWAFVRTLIPVQAAYFITCKARRLFGGQRRTASL